MSFGSTSSERQWATKSEKDTAYIRQSPRQSKASQSYRLGMCHFFVCTILFHYTRSIVVLLLTYLYKLLYYFVDALTP